LAALVLGEIEERVERDYGMAPGVTGPDNRASAALDGYRATLGLARDCRSGGANGTSGSLLADRVMAMVERDPAVPYSEAGIAAAANVTPHHFAACFQQYTGIEFSSFLLARRIARAQELLRDPRLDVAEVAERSGFPDSAYFIRRFRRETGCTPMAWRAENGGPAASRERSNKRDTTGAPAHSMGEWDAATNSAGKD
jgi:AraC-like DNA-binding protein